MSQYLLEMNNVSKGFPGVQALNNVSINVKPGEVLALMGENGAGKSTLMKCLFGVYQMDEGEILLEGKAVNFSNALQALEGGIAMVQQELNQATKRNVMDNLWLGRYPQKFGIMVDQKRMIENTNNLLKSFKIEVDPFEILSNLSVSTRQMLEIVKAVSYDAKVIVFDEPTSSLSDSEVEQLFRIISMLKNRGCGIIYISHKMEEILRISDRVTILRDGQYVSTSDAKTLTMDRIIKDMVGRDLTNRFPARNTIPGDTLLKVDNIASKHKPNIKNISFELKKGEVLGISGLVGAGRTEILELIFGYMERMGGNMYLNGQEIFNQNPKESIRNKFALITEERRETGIFKVLSIKENTVISNLDKYKKKNVFLSDHHMQIDTKEIIKSLRVKTPSSQTKIGSLSGGNQQKVIFGRWLLTEPQVLLMDEPTRGIDVGAKFEIYQLMNQMVENGQSIIMVSSEMPELIGMCDRIMVVSNGQITGIVDAKQTSQEEIMALSAKNL